MGKSNRTYVGKHEGSALQEIGGIDGKLGLVDIGAVFLDVGAVIDAVCLVVNELDLDHPVPSFDGRVGVRVVAGIPSQTGGEIQEASVGDAALIVVPHTGRGKYPSQPTTARVLRDLVLKKAGLHVKHLLGLVNPLGLVLGRAGEVVLGREQRRQSPYTMVVVGHGGRLVE